MGVLEQLDESALRRPDFKGGHPVTLKDGSAWMFPIPRNTFVPDATCEDGARAVCSLGEPYLALVDALRSDQIAELPDLKVASRELALWSHMLRLNYTISDEQLPLLLEVAYGDDSDPILLAIREEVYAVVRGDRKAEKKALGPGQS